MFANISACHIVESANIQLGHDNSVIRTRRDYSRARHVYSPIRVQCRTVYSPIHIGWRVVYSPIQVQCRTVYTRPMLRRRTGHTCPMVGTDYSFSRWTERPVVDRCRRVYTAAAMLCWRCGDVIGGCRIDYTRVRRRIWIGGGHRAVGVIALAVEKWRWTTHQQGDVGATESRGLVETFIFMIR